MENSLVFVGKIVKTQGIKGEIRISGSGSLPLTRGTKVILTKEPGAEKTLTIDSSRKKKHLTILAFQEIKKAEEAEDLVGSSVYVAEGNLAALPPDEFYWHQILNMEVKTEAGISLGRVKEIFATGSNDVFVVQNEGGEVLIPATDEVVRKVDLKKKIIIIRPLEGMLPE